MNKFSISILFVLAIHCIQAQSPSFKYQGVARNAQNAVIANQDISLRLSIRNASNNPLYTEIHNTRTSDLGLFSVNVCAGTTPTGNCSAIDWSVGGYQLKVEIDPTGGNNFIDLGNSPILHVPLAAFATRAMSAINGDADSNPQNELQNLSFNTSNNTLAISQGNSVDLSALKNDADADPENEIQTILFDSTNNQVTLTKNGGSFILPSGGNSLWTKNGDTLQYVTGNNSIKFNPRGSKAIFDINFRSNAARRFSSESLRWSEEYWTKPSNALGKEIAYGGHIEEYPTTYNRLYLRFNNDTFYRASSYNFLFTPGSSPGTVTQSEIFSQANNNGQPVRVLSARMEGGGGVGNVHAYLAGRNAATTGVLSINNVVTPFSGIWAPNGNNIFGLFFNAQGQAQFAAQVKNFVEPHPSDPDKEIWYACIEGPEAGTYERGTAQLVNGQAEIKFSEHFSAIVNPSTITVILTPLSADSEGMAVVEKTPRGFKVKELRNGKGTYGFDWEVKGVRKGYENYQPVRPKQVVKSASDRPIEMD